MVKIPFASGKQEVYMMINKPNIWKKWVKKYGHHPDFRSALRSSKNKSNSNKSKRRRRKKSTKKNYNRRKTK